MFSGGVDGEPLLLLLFDVGAEKRRERGQIGSIVVNFQVGISIEEKISTHRLRLLTHPAMHIKVVGGML